MNLDQLTSAIALLSPHLVAVALIATRLVPVGILSPVLGPSQAPMHVRLAVVLSLALCIHLAGGVQARESLASLWPLLGAVLRELCVGTAMGLIAALPFDAARMGGRFMDLFRGTSAEAALPLVGTRESATADGLHQLTLAMVSAGAGLPLVIAALFRSFGALPVGSTGLGAGAAFHVVSCATVSLATALAIAAPVLGAVLAVDVALGIAGRALPQFALQAISSPAKILGGGAIIWLGLGTVATQLLDGVSLSEEHLAHLFEVLR